MTEDEAVKQFGLTPKPEDLPAIRQLLIDETSKAKTSKGDEPLVRVFCIQLFSHGMVEDSLLIWRAKRSNFDAVSAIDVQLLCGAGFEITRQYLASIGSAEAAAALAYLNKCEQHDFKDWTPARHMEFYRNYYRSLL